MATENNIKHDKKTLLCKLYNCKKKVLQCDLLRKFQSTV